MPWDNKKSPRLVCSILPRTNINATAPRSRGLNAFASVLPLFYVIRGRSCKDNNLC